MSVAIWALVAVCALLLLLWLVARLYLSGPELVLPATLPAQHFADTASSAQAQAQAVRAKVDALRSSAARVPLRQRLASVPGITVTQVGLLDAVGATKPLQFSIQGPDLRELQRLTNLVLPRLAQIPGLVDVDTSAKPDKPVSLTVAEPDTGNLRHEPHEPPRQSLPEKLFEKRRAVFPQAVRGFYRNVKYAVMLITLGIYYATP